MPKISERQKLIKEVDHVLKRLAIFGEDNTDDFEELLMLKWQIESCRYFNLRQHFEKNRTMNDMLWRFSETDFRQIVRMNKKSFKGLVGLLGSHRVFHNRSRVKQAPAWIQIMVTLQRFGCDGTGNSNGRIARNCGYSNGSVVNFGSRVQIALLSLKKEVVRWPNAEERKQISARFSKKMSFFDVILCKHIFTTINIIITLSRILI